jgi:hypothetical protein
MSPTVQGVVYVIVAICSIGTLVMLLLRDRRKIDIDVANQTRQAAKDELALQTKEIANELAKQTKDIAANLAAETRVFGDALNKRVDGIVKTMGEIHMQTKLSNGRVGVLEGRAEEDRAAHRDTAAKVASLAMSVALLAAKT